MSIKRNTGQVVVLAPPPPAGRIQSTPLSRLSEVRYELSKLYREARNGKINVSDATRLAYLLQVLAKIIEGSDLERRIEALEKGVSK